VRWGLPDAALVWVAGVIASVLGASAGAVALSVPTDEIDDHVGVLLCGIAAQDGVILGAIAVLTYWKGQSSLRRDFGLAVAWEHPWLWGALYLVSGLALQIVSSLLLLPVVELSGRDDAQGVVESFEDARGLELALFALAVAVVAPLAEELLFRGVLLRALRRRTTTAWAVFGSAVVFAGIHVLLAPTVGDLMAVPALMALGLVSGAVAVATGRLYGSVLLHVGFNLLTAVVVVAG
jgi:uncharacterized protein